MAMKLSEALNTLLGAEDEAVKIRDAAEQEAHEIARRTQEAFAEEQETRLNAAREEARATVDSARQAVEMEALHISELARSSRGKMSEHFEERAPVLAARLAENMATLYAARGRREPASRQAGD